VDEAVIRVRIDKVWRGGKVTDHAPGYRTPITVSPMFIRADDAEDA